MRWWVGEVVDTVQETPRVKSLLISAPGWEGHRPGQHVDIRLTAEDGYQAVRSYSIASAPEDEHLMLTVEELEDGEVSPYLVHELRQGDQLEFLGPIGGYFVWTARASRPLLLVAGGSGIAPLMAMLRHRARAGSTVPAQLLYSSRTFDDIIFRAELERLAASDTDLEVAHTLTRARPPEWTGYARRVDAAMLREVAWPVEREPLAYICGPTAFVEVVASSLVELGYTTAQVKTERFGPTGS